MLDVPIYAVPSVTKIEPGHAGAVVIAGSHGGIYPGYLAAKAKVRAVALNDAGVGMEQAGIGSLAYLEALGMAAIAVSSETARIGDGRDMLARGVVSHVNGIAEAFGVRSGQLVREAAIKLRRAPMLKGEPPAYAEARHLLRERPGQAKVWGLDSVSLVRTQDAGHVIVAGSHGGLLAGETGSAIKVEALAAAFNDAGIGIDQAGISRLPALDQRGIPACTLNHRTCRIGDAKSAWATGIVSRCNDAAKALGVKQGMTTRDFALKIVEAPVF